ELHLFETLEQGLGVLLVASLARVVGAQRHAAHAGQLLRRDLGIFVALELVPEALVRLAAIHLALGRHSPGHHAESHKADESRPEHAFLRLLVENSVRRHSKALDAVVVWKLQHCPGFGPPAGWLAPPNAKNRTKRS